MVGVDRTFVVSSGQISLGQKFGALEELVLDKREGMADSYSSSEFEQTAGDSTANLQWLNRTKVTSRWGYQLLKRLFDIVASLCGLIILSPVFLIIALLIKFDDPHGPVFFSQIRVGQDGQKFRMYKFRSMCVNAEDKLAELMTKNEVDGAMFKMKHDPRVTKIGHFIRKTSIDEFPQLLNVLLGNMSLVGPRPPLPREVAEYTNYDRQRLLVKPGCTGLWQVSGRNDVGFQEMVDLDIRYIRQSSVKFDLQIIWATVAIIFHPNGAY